MVDIGQNSAKSPGDLSRLAIIQTPVKDPQPTLEEKLTKNKTKIELIIQTRDANTKHGLGKTTDLQKLKENEKRDEYIDLEKTMEHKSNGDNTWCFCYNHQRISTRTG